MGFSEQLRKDTDAIWRASAAHPFVRGIGDGSLDIERFKYYVKQDYVFLIEFSRVLALAAAKAPDLPTMAKLADLLNSTLNVEMDLHRRYCARFGISSAELETTAAAPTTHAYTRHMLAVAYSGETVDTMAALLPCVYGYYEHGCDLARRGEPAQAPLYAEWIRMYSSSEYGELAEWLRSAFDRLAEGLPPVRLQALSSHYRISAYYEYLFWDMAYRMEEWPVARE
jgi:thiaminase/transcriptional activator TenA